MDEKAVPSCQLLWAKTSKHKSTTHPLICHLIDVAQVAWAMWNHVLTASMRTHIATALGLDEEPAGRQPGAGGQPVLRAGRRPRRRGDPDSARTLPG